jgi:hypothetical protein
MAHPARRTRPAPERDRSCPSGRAVLGASLIGIAGEDGRLGYLRDAIPLDDVFLETTRGRTPMRRFRFSEPCVEAGCCHWTGSRCGLIDEIVAVANGTLTAAPDDLPRCSIRKTCRWFSQVGREACMVCPLIVRGGDEEEWALAAPGLEGAG